MINPDPETSELDTNWSAPLQALWWIKKGNFAQGEEWENAHNLCQQNEGDPAHDWVHALVHWIEGDDWNSSYWLRSAGKERVCATPADEWQILAKNLGQGAA